MIGQMIGNYRIVRRIGEGGMGEVFEAVHEQIKRRAAVKVLNATFSQNPEMTQRFFNEALAVNVIQHPSIVGVFESGHLPDKRAFIVMEFLDGQSLSKRLARDKSIPEAEALRLTRQVAAALAAAHDKRIVHRDLKSDNVMLVADPEVVGKHRVKVLDFGIAKISTEHQVRAVKTQDGTVMGTPQYMSPEQWMSSNDVDAKADVYALGVMLYEMLAGRYPFMGSTTNQLMTQHLYEQARPLNELSPVSPEVASLVEQMLLKMRGGRPSMHDVVQRIDALLERKAMMSAPTAALHPMPQPIVPQGLAPSSPATATEPTPGPPSAHDSRGGRADAMTLLSQQDATRMAHAAAMPAPSTAVSGKQRESGAVRKTANRSSASPWIAVLVFLLCLGIGVVSWLFVLSGR